jgi:hypothetical protein
MNLAHNWNAGVPKKASKTPVSTDCQSVVRKGRNLTQSLRGWLNATKYGPHLCSFRLAEQAAPRTHPGR